MKNILNYYYQIIIDDDKINSNGYFSYNNHLFCLYKYQRNIDEISSLVELNNYMINQNIGINRIIFNIYNKPLTYYEENNYILLLVNYEYKGGIFKFIPINGNNYQILKRNNWSYLWSMKVDYIEYQIKHLTNKYKILNETVNYYIGITENAIKYFNMIKLDNVNLFIGHRRINKDDLYNPAELVIDYKVRDISEYLKKCFFEYNKSIYEIKKYLININLSSIDYILLYIRMLYPSYYFDIYEKIVNKNYNEKDVLKVTNNIDLYEELLYEIYLYIRRKINIIGITWINKKFE